MKKTVGFAAKLFKEYPRKMGFVVFLMTTSGVLEGLGISLFIPLLQLVQENNQTTEHGRLLTIISNLFNKLNIPLTLGSVLVFSLGVFFLQYLVILVQQHQFYKLGYRFQLDLREKLFDALMLSKWEFFVNNKIGSFSNALIGEPKRAFDAYHALTQGIALLVVSSIYLILAFAISWQMTLVILAVGTFLALLMRKNINKAHQLGQSITAANNELQMETMESLSGVKFIKSSDLKESASLRFKNILNKIENRSFASSFNIAIVKTIYEFSMIGLLILIIYISVTYFNINLSKLAIFLFIFYRLSPRLTNVQNTQHIVIAGLPAVEEIEKTYKKAVNEKETIGGANFNALTRDIALSNVSFFYNKGSLVLENININIPKGKIIALVGKSGSGKSTLVDLIMGLITPIRGQVLIDDVALSEINLSTWRKRIGYLPQDIFLFHDTLISNIAWAASKNISKKEVFNAVKLANANEFIEKMPMGYDTILGDRGTRLSGGQRQRIALARALIRKPDILILDEATSSLDSESEIKIQQAIENLAGNMTIIIVTHRLSTVKNADIIYVLENGCLIETGTWAKLVSNKNGYFQKMQELQLI